MNWYKSAQTITLFRGIKTPDNKDPSGRVGRWWTTNPYYAINFTQNGNGLFIAQIPQSNLQEMIRQQRVKDVTQDDYANYLFVESDPPNVRAATPQEIQTLLSHTVTTPSANKRPGGDMRSQPTDLNQINGIVRDTFGSS